MQIVLTFGRDAYLKSGVPNISHHLFFHKFSQNIRMFVLMYPDVYVSDRLFRTL